MDIGVISVRYARALLKSATEAGLEDQVYADMRTLADSYLQVAQLRSTMDNPMLSADNKLALLKTACGGSPTPLTEKFLSLVLGEGRESFLQFMATSYATLYRKQKHFINGRLITAVPVAPATEKRLREMVERKADGQVTFQTETDPDIIGGFILEYDTYRLDASVKSKLKSVLTQLKK